MPSWNGTYLIFPDHVIEESSGGDEFSTTIIETRGSEARTRNWADSRRRISLAGGKLLEENKRTIEAFMQVLGGQHKPFLFMDAASYLIQDTNGGPSLLGTGNGATTTFQLRLYFTYQGQTATRTIKFPDHDYSPILDAYGNQWRGTNLIKVYLNDVEQASGWTVDRNTGIVTFSVAPANGVTVKASGQFYNLVRWDMPALMLKPIGAGVYLIEQGELVEPKGGA